MPLRKYATQEEAQAARKTKMKGYTNKYRKNHMEQYRGYANKAYQADPKKLRARKKADYAKHRDKRRAHNRDYYWDHVEERAASNKAWRVRTYGHIWLRKAIERLLNPATEAKRAKKRLWQARRKARKLGLPDTFTAEQRLFMLQYWGYACAICGNQEGFVWTLADDHWVPISHPACPGTVATNMIPLCHGQGGCNNAKHDTDPHTWLLQRFDPRKVARIEKAIATYVVIVAERFRGDDGCAAAD